MIEKMFPRRAWDAIAAKWATKHRGLPVRTVFIHHGASIAPLDLRDADGDGIPDNEESIWRAYQRHHMTTRGWSDIAYNFGVGMSGTWLEGRGYERQGGATGYPHDGTSLSICAIGNFENQVPTNDLLEAIVIVIIVGIERGYIQEDVQILGHKNASGAATSCPGTNLYSKLDYIRRRVREELAKSKESDNMSFDQFLKFMGIARQLRRMANDQEKLGRESRALAKMIEDEFGAPPQE